MTGASFLNSIFHNSWYEVNIHKAFDWLFLLGFLQLTFYLFRIFLTLIFIKKLIRFEFFALMIFALSGYCEVLSTIIDYVYFISLVFLTLCIANKFDKGCNLDTEFEPFIATSADFDDEALNYRHWIVSILCKTLWTIVNHHQKNSAI